MRLFNPAPNPGYGSCISSTDCFSTQECWDGKCIWRPESIPLAFPTDPMGTPGSSQQAVQAPPMRMRATPMAARQQRRATKHALALSGQVATPERVRRNPGVGPLLLSLHAVTDAQSYPNLWGTPSPAPMVGVPGPPLPNPQAFEATGYYPMIYNPPRQSQWGSTCPPEQSFRCRNGQCVTDETFCSDKMRPKPGPGGTMVPRPPGKRPLGVTRAAPSEAQGRPARRRMPNQTDVWWGGGGIAPWSWRPRSAPAVGISPTVGPAPWGAFQYQGGFWPWNGTAPYPGQHHNPVRSPRGTVTLGHTIHNPASGNVYIPSRAAGPQLPTGQWMRPAYNPPVRTPLTLRSRTRPTTAPKGVTPRGAATPYGAPKPTCPPGQKVLWDHVENMWRCFPATRCPEGYRWDDYWDAKQQKVVWVCLPQTKPPPAPFPTPGGRQPSRGGWRQTLPGGWRAGNPLADGCVTDSDCKPAGSLRCTSAGVCTLPGPEATPGLKPSTAAPGRPPRTMPVARPAPLGGVTQAPARATPVVSGAPKFRNRNRGVAQARARLSNPPPVFPGPGAHSQFAPLPPQWFYYTSPSTAGAPQAPGIQVAAPGPPPGVFGRGGRCYNDRDCAENEYCHGGICLPKPWSGQQQGIIQPNPGRQVGAQEWAMGLAPNPGDDWVLTHPTKRAFSSRPGRRRNPDGMVSMTQPLAPGFQLR